jgi:hypothetical protein
MQGQTGVRGKASIGRMRGCHCRGKLTENINFSSKLAKIEDLGENADLGPPW